MLRLGVLEDKINILFVIKTEWLKSWDILFLFITQFLPIPKHCFQKFPAKMLINVPFLLHYYFSGHTLSFILAILLKTAEDR